MGVRSSAVDQYILKAQPFAQPILLHIRELVHLACPEAEEKVKWGMPFFDYKGDMLCHMAAFKAHAVMGFWKAPLMKDPILMKNAQSENAMGHLGRLTSVKDLPSDKKLMAWIKEAMKLNDAGIKLPKQTPDKKTTSLKTPPQLINELKANPTAKAHWESFPPGCKKEYVQWITEAKMEATKEKRLKEAILLISQGKKNRYVK